MDIIVPNIILFGSIFIVSKVIEVAFWHLMCAVADGEIKFE